MIYHFNQEQLSIEKRKKLSSVMAKVQDFLLEFSETDNVPEVEVFLAELPYKFFMKVGGVISVILWDYKKADYFIHHNTATAEEVQINVSKIFK